MTNKVQLFSSIKTYDVLVDDVEYIVTETYNQNSDWTDTEITDEDKNSISDYKWGVVYSVFLDLRENK